MCANPLPPRLQDGRFATEFTRFAGSMLTKAPAARLDLLLGGLGALKDELLWFAATAAKRGLPPPPGAPPHPACQRYLQFMDNAAKQPYAVHAVVFWAIERCYWEAWSSHLPMREPYHSFALRWGSPEFGAYVGELEQMADEALAAGSEAERWAAWVQRLCRAAGSQRMRRCGVQFQQPRGGQRGAPGLLAAPSWRWRHAFVSDAPAGWRQLLCSLRCASWSASFGRWPTARGSEVWERERCLLLCPVNPATFEQPLSSWL